MGRFGQISIGIGKGRDRGGWWCVLKKIRVRVGLGVVEGVVESEGRAQFQ